MWSKQTTAVLSHERLAIVDVASGSQPLRDPIHGNLLAVNGEIYNHRALKRMLLREASFTTESDCEVMLPLYLQFGAELVQHLEGMYAFVLLGTRDRSLAHWTRPHRHHPSLLR